MTELWFLKESIGTKDIEVSSAAGDYFMQVRTPKFGYDECYIDIDDTRYLVKHRTESGPTHGGSWNGINVVFFVRKHKNKIGQ